MSEREERLDRIQRDLEDIRKYVLMIAEYLPKLLALAEHLHVAWGEFKPVFISDYVFADPHAGPDGHLDGAYSEGEWIRDILNNKGRNVTMKRHPVTKQTFLTNMKGKSIVHLAGHGGYSSSTGQCYLVFDDGNVYPGDVQSQTGAPKGLMYAGVCLGGKNNTLAQAFLDKGTDMYVGFTTTIPDWDAAYFDKLVYEKYITQGKTLRTALDESDDVYPALNTWVLWEA